MCRETRFCCGSVNEGTRYDPIAERCRTAVVLKHSEIVHFDSELHTYEKNVTVLSSAVRLLSDGADKGT
jgi:hypothetical protein